MQGVACLALVVATWPVAASAQDSAAATTETTGTDPAATTETTGTDPAATTEATGTDPAEATQGDAVAQLGAMEGQLVGLTEVVPSGSEMHDGFLLRFVLGLGYVAFFDEENDSTSDTGSRTTEAHHSACGGLAIALGGSPTENFHMYGELHGNRPQIFAFGLGLGGYFADNWFLDVAGGYELFAAGYGAVTLGKEWWVSEQWGMGVALRGIVYGAGPPGAGELGTTWTLNWTATYN